MSVNKQTQWGEFWDANHPVNKVNVSLPDGKFHSFKSIDDAINVLYVAGHRELSREINIAYRNKKVYIMQRDDDMSPAFHLQDSTAIVAEKLIKQWEKERGEKKYPQWTIRNKI